MRYLFLALLVFSLPVMAQTAPPEFSDGEVFVEPAVDLEETKVMATRFAKCGAYAEAVRGDVEEFPQAAYKLLTMFAYVDALSADELVMAAYGAQKEALGMGDDTQIASLQQECDNLADLRNEVIAMEREVYE